MAIFGDMLSFFPELKRKYVTFRAQPLVTGMYGPRTDESTIIGILQYMKYGDIVKQGNLEADTEVPVLWTRGELFIDSYLIDEDGVVFKRTKPNDWHNYGGFRAYVLETVIGATEQESDPGVNTVTGRYV